MIDPATGDSGKIPRGIGLSNTNLAQDLEIFSRKPELKSLQITNSNQRK
jgi:hypothetical protein